MSSLFAVIAPRTARRLEDAKAQRNAAALNEVTQLATEQVRLTTSAKLARPTYADEPVVINGKLERYVHQTWIQYPVHAQGYRPVSTVANGGEKLNASLKAAVQAALPELQVLDVHAYRDMGLCGVEPGVCIPGWARLTVEVRNPAYATQRASETGKPITEDLPTHRPGFFARLKAWLDS